MVRELCVCECEGERVYMCTHSSARHSKRCAWFDNTSLYNHTHYDGVACVEHTVGQNTQFARQHRYVLKLLSLSVK